MGKRGSRWEKGGGEEGEGRCRMEVGKGEGIGKEACGKEEGEGRGEGFFLQ